MKSFKEFYLREEYILEPNTQYGSNVGGVYHNMLTNTKEYVKFPKTHEQAKVEVATSELYKHMGITTANPYIKTVQGKQAVTSDWNPNLVKFRSAKDIVDSATDPKRAHQLALMHHAAIITGNRDIIGLAYDNVYQHKDTGDLVSLDQGGSMHFRAQGDPKPFEKDIADVHSFQNPTYSAGEVFSKIAQSHLKDAAHDLNKLTDDKIDATLKPHGLEHLGDTIKARRDMLIKHYLG